LSEKTRKLCEVLQVGTFWKLNAVATIVQSYEVQLIQLCDLLIGAVAYRNRDDIEHSSAIKMQFVQHLESRLGYSLDYATPPWEEQFNIFRFQPRRSNAQ